MGILHWKENIHEVNLALVMKYGLHIRVIREETRTPYKTYKMADVDVT